MEHGLVAVCGHLMKAESADPPVYVFDGSSGSCTPTTLTLRHDVDNQRIGAPHLHGVAPCVAHAAPGTG